MDVGVVDLPLLTGVLFSVNAFVGIRFGREIYEGLAITSPMTVDRKKGRPSA
jgi:hypothetical protein